MASWKELYQYSNAKGFPEVYTNKKFSNAKIPSEWLQHCVPKCFPAGADEYTDDMME